jgi:hypothetical protein
MDDKIWQYPLSEAELIDPPVRMWMVPFNDDRWDADDECARNSVVIR